jgi:hypothetical protein
MPHKPISVETLIDLRRRLETLPARSPERRRIIQETATLYGVSEYTLYRVLRASARPRPLQRANSGEPRILPKPELERYCEIIAAIKLRTSNRKGRHLSTSGAIRLLEAYGFETPDGFVKAPKGVLKTPTVNRYLKQWGYGRNRLLREPAVTHFQARHSNECWQFDLSPSDLKRLPEPPLWIDQSKGQPTLMIYSVTDDRSGMNYQEYHCVYGEDVEAALRFLFRAMAPKKDERFPFQGRPHCLYMDSGPIAKSQLFQQVMRYLDIKVMTHMPAGKDGRRTTARAKGKVERAFRTVKEMHETLYHFHKPQTEEEANAWLLNYLVRYNDMAHRCEPHSRREDWQKNLPSSGIREMCSWERFCTFAREPMQRKVSSDAQVSIDGVSYEVDPDLAGETVVLWFGVFDDELYVEQGEQRYGLYRPAGGPIPLHRYRKFKKTRTQKQADRIEAIAQTLILPRAALSDDPSLADTLSEFNPPSESFTDPDPFHELAFPSVLAAKQAIADYLAMPLARLPQEQLDALNALLAKTLTKQAVFDYVRYQLQPLLRG